jgi:hypothetical protein
VEEPPPPPRTINPDLTPAFEAAILHCLQKLPDDRPATGELLSQELVTLLPATLETSAYRTRITGSEPTVVVRSDSQVAIPAPTPERKPRAAPWLVGTALVAGLVVGVSLFARSREAESAAPVGKQPDSIVATNPPPTTPVNPAIPVDSTGKKDSVPRPVRMVGSLRVSAPPTATVSAAGREALGGLDIDSLKPQIYQITASVPAPAGCPTATVTLSAEVKAVARPTRVTVAPRSCGTLFFTSNVRDVNWSLRSLTAADSGALQRGSSLPANVTLPVGSYERAFMKPKCGSYIDTVRVAASKVDTLPRRNPDC